MPYYSSHRHSKSQSPGQRTLKSMCEGVDDDSASEEVDDIGTEVACDVLEIPGNDGDRGPGVGHD